MTFYSTIDKLEKLFTDIGRGRGFRAERHDKGLWLLSDTGKFSRRNHDLIMGIADNYGCTFRVGSPIIVSRKGMHTIKVVDQRHRRK